MSSAEKHDPTLVRPWLPERLARLEEIANLDENWDSYHALPPAEAAISTTRALVQMLSAWHTVNPQFAPQFCPTVDGGVQIEWHEQGYNLEITIEPDGRIGGWLNRHVDGADVEW
jgi:hypothetical protein